MNPFVLEGNHQFYFETLRVLGATAYGMADVGEVVATAQRVVEGDYNSWHNEWLSTAQRVESEAERSAAGGHWISARDAWLRASSYYRSAEFFLHGDASDQRHFDAYFKSVDCFRNALPHLDVNVEAVEIPYEGTVLHGYFYRGRSEKHALPTVVAHSGFDGSSEEMHTFGGVAGAERGYNVLIFDGPGQSAAIHRDGLVFRPDWENVVGPALDWVVKRPGVDPGRIGLIGVSMGGLLAPRAAAFDNRVAACVAIEGIYDWGEVLSRQMGLSRDAAYAAVNAADAPQVDAALEHAKSNSPTLKWAIEHGSYVMGAETPRAFFAKYFEHHLADGIAEQIQCPTLVCDADDDDFFDGQAMRLYDQLTCPKDYLLFTSVEGAGEHCHVAALRLLNARVYDWLDDRLKV